MRIRKSRPILRALVFSILAIVGVAWMFSGIDSINRRERLEHAAGSAFGSVGNYPGFMRLAVGAVLILFSSMGLYYLFKKPRK